MTNSVKLLDHGYVRLVDHMGNDLSVVRAARVSHEAAWRAGEDHGSDDRLVRYLWRNGHTSPFEAVEFQFEVKAPIFVLRQWHRHRTWSYNEVSARYCEVTEDEFYVPTPDTVGEQSKDNKQGRQSGGDSLLRERQIDRYRSRCREAIVEYHSLLLDGWPRELARCVLPVSTYSHMFAKVDLLNLFRFLTLRCDTHAQYEIRVYAEAIRDLIRPIVPTCVKAWES